MNRTDTQAAIATALAKFQKDCPTIVKGRTAKIPGKDGKQGYSYKYADLGDIIDTVKATLATNGLSVSQDLGSDGQFVTCSTTVMHESGEWFESGYYMLPAGNTPQTAGSAATYCRRYSYSAALGIASEEDDDGAGATHSADAGSASGAIGSDAPILKAVHGKKAALDMTDKVLRAGIKRDYGVEHEGDLTMAQAKELCDKLDIAIAKSAEPVVTLGEEVPF